MASDSFWWCGLCRTREEVRELLRERTKEGLFGRLAVSARPVKVRIRMEVMG